MSFISLRLQIQTWSTLPPFEPISGCVWRNMLEEVGRGELRDFGFVSVSVPQLQQHRCWPWLVVFFYLYFCCLFLNFKIPDTHTIHTSFDFVTIHFFWLSVFSGSTKVTVNFMDSPVLSFSFLLSFRTNRHFFLSKRSIWFINSLLNVVGSLHEVFSMSLCLCVWGPKLCARF